MPLKLLKLVLWLAAVVYVMRQVRKPDRFAGRLFALLMNRSHSKLTDWGLTHVPVETGSTVLDVGCGGGRTVEKLSGLAGNGKVYGVDYAPGSVATARWTNADLIRSGRVHIEQASVSKLPFRTDTFSVVTAIETQYYWPDLANDMREVFRVLQPGGVLAVVAESYRGGAGDAVQGPVMKLLGSSRLGVREHTALFAGAGFEEVQVFQQSKKGWICVTGRKPA